MWQRIKHMLIKEFLQNLRDPRMLRVLFIMPAVQTLIFGYAVTTDVRNVSVAIYDQDNSVESRELIDRFLRSGYFDRTQTLNSERQVIDAMDSGNIRGVIRIDKGFAQDLRGGRTAQLQLLLDGTDSNTGAVVMNYAGTITEQYSNEILQDRVQRTLGAVRQPGRVTVERRAWFNPNLESRNFYVPGIIAQIITLITFMLTSMAIVREIEIGTMEQIIVTPIRPFEFILGKTAPFALISFAIVLIISAVGVFWFGVPIRGSFLLLLGATALYLLTTLGVGLLISTVSSTQQQAMMVTFLVNFPIMLLSGFVFPISAMPQWIQTITVINPLRYFIVIIRAIFLKGTGLSVLWPEFLALTILGLTTFTIAASRFRKTLA
jgi:ABC-2 type transport system permease protein